MGRNFHKVACAAAALAIFLILSSSAGAVEPIGQNDLIYFVMTDRFYDAVPNEAYANKKDPAGYHGGDLPGVTGKLDYIKSLGFTTVWITPVMDNQSGGYHGYWAIDFYAVDEHLGTMDDLKELVTAAHARDMKIILDIVINHTGSLHPYVYDRPDWFHPRSYINDCSDQKQVENGWLAGLPDLNTENPEVRRYLIDMALWWIKHTGIDGFRLDTAKHVPKDFIVEFTTAVKAEYPAFYIVGEAFDGRASYIEGYVKAGLDGMLDFPMYYGINDSLARDKGSIGLWNAVMSGRSYSRRELMATFLDNHDVQRFVYRLDEPEARLMQALSVVMTYTGIPVVYYGTEIALDGGSDPDNRRDMVFEENPLQGFVRSLASIRKANAEFTKGDIELIDLGTFGFAYQRTYDGSSSVLVLNISDEPRRFSFMLKTPGVFTAYSDMLGDSAHGGIDGGVIAITAPPRSALILKLK